MGSTDDLVRGSVLLDVNLQRAGFVPRAKINSYVPGTILPDGRGSLSRAKPRKRDVQKLEEATGLRTGEACERPPRWAEGEALGRQEVDAIHAMADYMGIRWRREERSLLPLAAEALQADLAEGWNEYVNVNGAVIYFNEASLRARVRHPSDEYFDRLLLRARQNMRAVLHSHLQMKTRAFQRWQGYTHLSKRSKRKRRLADVQLQIMRRWGGMLVRVSFRHWVDFVEQLKHDRERERAGIKTAAAHWRSAQKLRVWRRWQAFMEQRWSEQAKLSMAARHWGLVFGARTFAAWHGVVAEAIVASDRHDERRFEAARGHWRLATRRKVLLAWRRRSDGRSTRRVKVSRAATLWRRYWLRRGFRRWTVFCWSTDHGKELGLREAREALARAEERAKFFGTGRLRATRDLGRAEGSLHKALKEQRRLESALFEERKKREEVEAQKESLEAELGRARKAISRGEAQRSNLQTQLDTMRGTNVELRVRLVRFDAELRNARETERLAANVEMERLRTEVEWCSRLMASRQHQAAALIHKADAASFGAHHQSLATPPPPLPVSPLPAGVEEGPSDMLTAPDYFSSVEFAEANHHPTLSPKGVPSLRKPPHHIPFDMGYAN